MLFVCLFIFPSVQCTGVGRYGLRDIPQCSHCFYQGAKMSELDKDPPIQFDSDPEPDPDPIFLSFNNKLWVYQKNIDLSVR